jgi:hypothetical protein
LNINFSIAGLLAFDPYGQRNRSLTAKKQSFQAALLCPRPGLDFPGLTKRIESAAKKLAVIEKSVVISKSRFKIPRANHVRSQILST